MNLLNMHRKTIAAFLFLLIFIIGFLLRAQETISGNFLFLLDQGRDMLAVKGILYEHHLTLIGPYTSLQGVFQGPLWYYLLAIPTFIGGGNPWGGVVLMLIISLIVILLSFIFTKKLFGYKAAFITMFLMVICPEAIASATYAWNPHPMWLLLILYIFFFYKTSLNENKYHLLVWPIIALMFNFQTALAIFIFLASLIYLLLFNLKSFKNRQAVIGLSLFVIFLFPQIIFDIRHNFLISKSILNVVFGSNQELFKEGIITHFFTTLKDHLYVYSINFNSSFPHDGILKNLPNLFFLILILGIVLGKKTKYLSDKENLFVLFIAKLVIIIIILSLSYPFPLRAWFLTGFEVMYIFPLGIILSKFFYYKKSQLMLLIFVIANMTIFIPKIYDLYRYPDYGGTAKIKGKLDAIDYIYKDVNKTTFNLLIFTPYVYTDPYDYLIWWRAKNLYNYIPGKEKKGAFYLLIEPDLSQPWTYKGWLETVIKSGKVISTTELPSGLIVQKRSE